MSALNSWASLGPHIALAGQLFSDGSTRVTDWLNTALLRTTDRNFSTLFTDHIDWPGATADDYLHLIVTLPDGKVLGGIRFFGGDVARPFVELIAHDLRPPVDWAKIARAIAAEWQLFRPRSFRVFLTAAEEMPPEAQLDMNVHAAPYRAMAKPAAEVTLTQFPTVDAAIAMVRQRYDALATEAPDLARVITPATAKELQSWHTNGTLHALRQSGPITGLIATDPGKVEWIDGDVVTEEVVLPAHAGQGLAAAAQTALAARSTQPETLLLGTIAALNIASHRTALRAGRPVIARYAFVPLKPFANAPP